MSQFRHCLAIEVLTIHINIQNFNHNYRLISTITENDFKNHVIYYQIFKFQGSAAILPSRFPYYCPIELYLQVVVI